MRSLDIMIWAGVISCVILGCAIVAYAFIDHKHKKELRMERQAYVDWFDDPDAPWRKN